MAKTSAERVRELYARRREAGLCVRCGTRPLVNKSHCRICRGKNQAYNRAASRRRAGIPQDWPLWRRFNKKGGGA